MASRETTAAAAASRAKTRAKKKGKRAPARHDDDPVRVYGSGRVIYYPSGTKGVGDRKEKRCGNLADGEAFAAKLRKDFELMNGVMPGVFTTADQAFQSMLINLRATNMATSTINQYKSNWLCWVPDEVGAVLCKDLSLAHWSAIFDNALTNDASTSTVRNIARTINKFTSWAIEHEYVLTSEPFGPRVTCKNIVKKARDKAREPTSKRAVNGILLDHCPTEGQIEQYAQDVEKWYPGYGYRLVMMAWGTGMRIGELLALRHDSVDFTTGLVDVDWQLDRNKTWPARKRPKNGKARRTMMWERMDEIARSLIEDSLNRPEDDPHHGWLFPPHRSKTAWATMCGRLCGWAAAESDWSWTFHWLRHAYASFSLAPETGGGYGFESKAVSDWLGHAKESTTTDMYNARQQGDTAKARARTARPPGLPSAA